MTSRPRRWTAIVVVVAAALAVLVACTGSSPKRNGCHTECKGTIDGAAYAILVPKSWNGTLLLYSHGYAAAGTHSVPYLSQIDVYGNGADAVSQALLAKGYALAASSYRSTGWAVADALTDDERLHTAFTGLVGTPKRTIVWGSSMGGLITELLAERAGWVDGAVSLCGVVAGPLVNADNFARALALVSVLTGIDLTVTGRLSNAAITATTAAVGQKLNALAADRTGLSADLLAISIVLGLPGPSPTYSVDTISDRLYAAAENVTQYVGLGLAALDDLTRRYGRGFARPALGGVDFTPSPLLATGLTALGGSSSAIQNQIRAVPTPATIASARARVGASGDPTGRLRVPLLTVHDEDDPLVVAANESVLRLRVQAAGRLSDLTQAFIAPAPGRTPDYVGHCEFDAQTQVGAIVAEDRWITSGTPPSDGQLRADLGHSYDALYEPPAWPTSN